MPMSIGHQAMRPDILGRASLLPQRMHATPKADNSHFKVSWLSERPCCQDLQVLVTCMPSMS